MWSIQGPSPEHKGFKYFRKTVINYLIKPNTQIIILQFTTTIFSCICQIKQVKTQHFKTYGRIEKFFPPSTIENDLNKKKKVENDFNKKKS